MLNLFVERDGLAWFLYRDRQLDYTLQKETNIFNWLLLAKFDPIGDSYRVRAHGGSFPTLSVSRFLPFFEFPFMPFLYFVAHENLIELNDSVKRFVKI